MALTVREKERIFDEVFTNAEEILFRKICEELLFNQIWYNSEQLDNMRSIMSGWSVGLTLAFGGLDEATLRNDVNVATATAAVDKDTPTGKEIRALIEVLNKKDNNLVNRLNDIIDASNTIGTPSVKLAAIGAVNKPSTRSKVEAIQDYKDEVAAD